MGYRLTPPLRTLAGRPPKSVFLNVSETRRYLSTITQTMGLYTVRIELSETMNTERINEKE